MAAPSLSDWRQQVLQGIKAPVTPSNLQYLNAWQRAEGGAATNNPFNTTQPVSGASSYNTVGVRNYQTPEVGIQATIDTLTNGRYGNILGALRQGNDPMAAANALAASPWGTGGLVKKILAGEPAAPITGSTGSSYTPVLPVSSPVPAGPAIPAFKPPKFTDLPDFSTAITSSLGKSPEAMTQAIVRASQAQERAIYSQFPKPGRGPVTTPEAQAAKPPKMTVQTEQGNTVEVESRHVTPRDLQAVKLAEHFIGTPYSWGGGGPGGPSYGIGRGAHTKGFDCSGLLEFVWAKQGVDIGGVTYDQWKQGKPVPKNNLRAGDAVFFHPGPLGPEHVGMYLGQGKFIESPYTGSQVRISKLAGRGDFMGGRRYG